MGRPPVAWDHRRVRPMTTLALALLLVAILVAATVQLLLIASK
jgi:hypothetical protein